MDFAVSGSQLGPFALAVFRAMEGDSTLATLAPGGVHSVPPATEITAAYIKPNRRQMVSDGGSVVADMQRTSVWLDIWSPATTPQEAHSILSRLRVLFQRQPLTVAGYSVVRGSVECRNELVFQDVDPEMPGTQNWFHGVVEVTALVDEA